MKKIKSKIKYTELDINTRNEIKFRDIPIIIVDSGKKGPIVWLTSCIHGDEIGGIVVTQEITKKLKNNLLSGKVYIIPIMNSTGFENASRNVTLSGEDLNRSFPGNKNGTVAERIAEKIFSTILATKPTLVLDLHNDWIASIPHVFIDPCPERNNNETFIKSQKYAKLTGLINILDSENYSKTLTYNLMRNKIPAITLELGESYVVNENNVQIGVNSVWNIFADLKMVNSNIKFIYDAPKEIDNRNLVFSNKPFSSTKGIVRFCAKPGYFVKNGSIVAEIFDIFGKKQETIFTESDGIVLGHTDCSVVFPGSCIISFGNIINKKGSL